MNRYNELSTEDQTRFDRAINARASGTPVTISVENPKPPFRTALVAGDGITPERVAVYLPSNYSVLDHDCVAVSANTVVIGGRDSAGQTLEAYVTPRLAMGGMYVCEDEPELTSWTDEDDYNDSAASDQ